MLRCNIFLFFSKDSKGSFVPHVCVNSLFRREDSCGCGSAAEAPPLQGFGVLLARPHGSKAGSTFVGFLIKQTGDGGVCCHPWNSHQKCKCPFGESFRILLELNKKKKNMDILRHHTVHQAHLRDVGEITLIAGGLTDIR